MFFRESETTELKEIVVDDIKKEIIAFANCCGGKLYINVRDDGTVIGLDHPDEAALQISNMVRDAIKPDVTIFLHYETSGARGISSKGFPAANAGQMDENESVIWQFAGSRGEIARNDVENLLKVSSSTASRILRKMVQNRILEPCGKARNTKYIAGGKFHRKD